MTLLEVSKFGDDGAAVIAGEVYAELKSHQPALGIIVIWQLKKTTDTDVYDGI